MLLVSTSTLKWYWLHKIFKLVSRSWYDGINLDVVSGDYDTEDAEYIKELSNEFIIPVVSITAYERKMDNKTVDGLIELAEIIWARIINFYPPYRADKETSWFSEYLPKVKAKKPALSLCVINVEPKTFLFFIPEYKDATLETIKKITQETSLSISNVDPTTWVDLLKTFTLLGKTIKNVFLSDKSGAKQDISLWKWDMPLESLLIKLKENWYKWLFTLKISPKELGIGKDESVLKKLEEQKKYFEKYFNA
ncbi:MAG: hypothetical protein ACD_2C00006G0001 [uncultured bacterium (gcode 4)]|uniref:Uncharacterized protein n=1 Tax=uncultured bacterium (gcode 4) TaxID=1234023 RepID=K2H374_9BACT|nr:MAG: hypothetical protein ACD_2C00006G0001 [uncultured bacterium (gcode 4)]